MLGAPWLVLFPRRTQAPSTVETATLSGHEHAPGENAGARITPLVGIVSRLTGQKGFDLLPRAAPEFIAEGFLLVVLGTGEERYARFFRGLQKKFPDYVSVKIMYHDALAHKVEAGADLFLMPSRYEPYRAEETLKRAAAGEFPRAAGETDGGNGQHRRHRSPVGG